MVADLESAANLEIQKVLNHSYPPYVGGRGPEEEVWVLCCAGCTGHAGCTGFTGYTGTGHAGCTGFTGYTGNAGNAGCSIPKYY